MSHISRIKTQMVEAEYVKKALDDLGYEWAEEKTSQRQQISVKTGFLSPAIRLVKSTAYEIVADWGMIRTIKRGEFSQRLAQRYAYHAARTSLQAKGFDLVNEEKQKDGQIRLVLRRVQ